MNVRVITEPADEQVAFFADLKTPRQPGICIAEGERIVPRLFASDLEIISLYLTQEHYDNKKHLIEAHKQQETAQLILAPKSEIEKVVGFPLHQGIMAAVRIPKERSLEELLTISQKPQLFIILDTVADAENIGALYRTALAMGATGIIVDNRSVSPWIRRAVRVSMGAVFTLPTITSTDLLETITYLNRRGITTIAAEITDTSNNIWDHDLSGDVRLSSVLRDMGLEKRYSMLVATISKYP